MLHPTILCGGSGTRLWPMSRTLSPKQFVEYDKKIPTLFAQTFERVQHLQRAYERSIGAPIIVSHEEYRFYVASTLHDMSIPGSRAPNIILEPEGKNTAPAIALAALAALEADSDAILLVLPSDHALSPDNALIYAVDTAMAAAEQGFLVTFGISPDSPKTGYGYIHKGEPLDISDDMLAMLEQDIFHVRSFVEKPNLENATSMFEEGGYLWNSGMFMFRADAYLNELEKFMPDMVDTCMHAWKMRQQDRDFIRPDAAAIAACPTQSIDYAVMEHTSKAAVLPLPVSWNALGAWDSFYELEEHSKDALGNVHHGDALMLKTRNCYVHSGSRLVATLGLEDIIVVESSDAVLVAKRSYAQEVRTIAAGLKAQGRSEALLHQKVYRPWGHYESIIKSDRFQVKRIMVRPGEELSLQRHYHRAEHWIIVSGTAEITNDDKVYLLSENQSTYIAQGAKHRLRNPGIIPLELIEIQSGSYLGEDDIERFEDTYGRCPQG